MLSVFVEGKHVAIRAKPENGIKLKKIWWHFGNLQFYDSEHTNIKQECVPPTRRPYPVVSDGGGGGVFSHPLDADPLDADTPVNWMADRQV